MTSNTEKENNCLIKYFELQFSKTLVGTVSLYFNKTFLSAFLYVKQWGQKNGDKAQRYL